MMLYSVNDFWVMSSREAELSIDVSISSPPYVVCCISWLGCFDSAGFSVIFVTNHRTPSQPVHTCRHQKDKTSIPSSKLIKTKPPGVSSNKMSGLI